MNDDINNAFAAQNTPEVLARQREISLMPMTDSNQHLKRLLKEIGVYIDRAVIESHEIEEMTDREVYLTMKCVEAERLFHLVMQPLNEELAQIVGMRPLSPLMILKGSLGEDAFARAMQQINAPA